ncbi:hypothetical protein J5N97_030133 [Dioscorea zingiberensis]|uniref:Uncharacterized protein n=1 Tax=Dioscorea zingiberensis TaxID=325984 RepID=A0A9D5BX74_9LILI|nr:hypothetical protein J5N97_030133 [Dioscorea zingiberensis]
MRMIPEGCSNFARAANSRQPLNASPARLTASSLAPCGSGHLLGDLLQGLRPVVDHSPHLVQEGRERLCKGKGQLRRDLWEVQVRLYVLRTTGNRQKFGYRLDTVR